MEEVDEQRMIMMNGKEERVMIQNNWKYTDAFGEKKEKQERRRQQQR